MIWIIANWKLVLGGIGMAALAIALTTTTIDRNQWRAAARASDAALAKVKAAQPIAAAAQTAVNHAPAAKSLAIAENSNADAPAYYDAVHSAVAAHSVVVRADAQCPARAPDLSGADHVAAINDGLAANAGMVSRAKADDDLIVAAAGRAAQMHADAEALIAAGVAVPSAPAP